MWGIELVWGGGFICLNLFPLDSLWVDEGGEGPEEVKRR